jgi:hypothetical protein
MIFGFYLVKQISDDLALNIISKIHGTSLITPINNAIRTFNINHFTNKFSIWINVNANVLISGKETTDIEFIKEPDFLLLNYRFNMCIAELIGREYADELPPLNEWGCWTMRYGVDIKVKHMDLLIRLFEKTDMPAAHFDPKNAIDIANLVPKYLYTSTGKKEGTLEIYPKSGLLELNLLDYKVVNNNELKQNCQDVFRFVLNHSRRHMDYAKRFLNKFEFDLWRLDSFLSQLVVPNVVIKAYLDKIGNGDFYTYNKAVQLIENAVSSFENRKKLINLLNIIDKEGSIPKAREVYGDKHKFKKDLKMLREIGINGAILEADSVFDIVENPYSTLLEKCKAYSS